MLVEFWFFVLEALLVEGQDFFYVVAFEEIKRVDEGIAQN